MVTTKDIAERVELSVSTVGRALADDQRISDATKLRVRQAAAELGYVGNHAARMMRGVPSKVVGLVIPDIRNSFYSTIAHELSKSFSAQGFQLMLSETDDNRTNELRQVRELSANRVAGVIIVPTARPHTESIRLLQKIPHVQLLRRHTSLGAHWFGTDDTAMIAQATTHLIELGHERIAYIGGPTGLPTGRARLAGYRAAMREGERSHTLVEQVPPSSIDEGRRAIRRLLDTSPAPTAVVLGSVQPTLGVLDELRVLGVEVPAELSVVGFGDEPAFSWWGPGLSTISLPLQEMAEACGLWLVHRLANDSADEGAYTSVSPGTLVVRGSTGPPPPQHTRKAG
ncbi:MAG TPA: LacI family DNA-binding transcriptional regulator [Aldersonia sp.]